MCKPNDRTNEKIEVVPYSLYLLTQTLKTCLQVRGRLGQRYLWGFMKNSKVISTVTLAPVVLSNCRQMDRQTNDNIIRTLKG